MTDLQMAQERADAAIQRGMKRYHALMLCARKANELPDAELYRLADVLEKLTPDELNAALGYAEGIAAWRWVDEESADGTKATDGT